MVPSLILVLHFHKLGLMGKRLKGAMFPNPNSCRYPVKLTKLLPLHYLKDKSIFFLLPPEAGSRDFFISLPDDLHLFLSSIYNSQFCPYTGGTLSCINLHVAAWWLRHVCSRSPLTSSSTPRGRAGGHI